MKKQHTLPTSSRDLWKAGVLLLTLLTSGCTTPEPPALPPEVFYTLPPPSGGSTQIKSFPKGGEIPERLFFDMRLVYR